MLKRRVRLKELERGRITLVMIELAGNPTQAQAVAAKLQAIAGIQEVEVDAKTGTLTLIYNDQTAVARSTDLPLSVARVLGIGLTDLHPNDLRKLLSAYGRSSK